MYASIFIRGIMTEVEYEKRRIRNSVDDIVALNAKMDCEHGENGLLWRELNSVG